jgi:hypothetical protein
MPAGRPQQADPGTLYTFAHLFYWDFRRLQEGRSRWRFDKKKYQGLTKGVDDMQFISDEDSLRHEKIVDEEIRTGQLDRSQRESRIRHIADSENTVRRESYCRDAHEEAREYIKIPGEEDVIRALLDPQATPDQVRELCGESLMKIEYKGREIEVPAWPISVGSSLPTYLAQYAEQYVAALNDPRFPRCDASIRPSNRLKQFWFLSRALAGAVFGVSTRTAINLVGSLRPEETFERSRYAKSARLRRKYKRRS